MKKLLHFIALLATLVIPPRLALSHPQDFQLWTLVNAHISFDTEKRYQFFLEGQPRLGDNWQRAATTQINSALVYNWDRSLSLYAGYGWTPQYVDARYHRDFRDENRIWQQVLYRHDLFGIQWIHRIREEQRFQVRTSGVINRFRYLLKGSYPLNDSGDFGGTAFDEVMINLNGVQGGSWDGYDRNRLFLGTYWSVGTARYEVGYLGEHLKRFGPDERWAHALVLLAMYNF